MIRSTYSKSTEGFPLCSPDTGRFFIRSKGRVFLVEPIGGRSDWGDQDPVTKKLTGSYGKKYRGSIDKEESVITKENGFVNIHELPAGTSPIDFVDNLCDEK